MKFRHHLEGLTPGQLQGEAAGAIKAVLEALSYLDQVAEVQVTRARVAQRAHMPLEPKLIRMAVGWGRFAQVTGRVAENLLRDTERVALLTKPLQRSTSPEDTATQEAPPKVKPPETLVDPLAALYGPEVTNAKLYQSFFFLPLADNHHEKVSPLRCQGRVQQSAPYGEGKARP